MIKVANQGSQFGTARTSKVSWIGYHLNQAALLIRNETLIALKPLGITPPQLRVIEAISVGPISQVRLGEIVGMDRTTIVHVIDRLEELDVAKRHRDEKDRRSHAVALTPFGKKVLSKAQAAARAAEIAFLAPLTSGERDALLQSLQKLQELPTLSKENI